MFKIEEPFHVLNNELKINCVIIGDAENHFPFLNRINFEMKGNEWCPFPPG